MHDSVVSFVHPMNRVNKINMFQLYEIRWAGYFYQLVTLSVNKGIVLTSRKRNERCNTERMGTFDQVRNLAMP